LHFEIICNPFDLFIISISTEFKGIWWQRGIKSDIFFAANIPAVLATEPVLNAEGHKTAVAVAGYQIEKALIAPSPVISQSF